jgi:NADH-quinone oxidoreductase subunit F
LIFTRGVDWFNSVGSPNNGGPKLICLSGHIERPGVYEVPNGYPCDQLIDLAGGVWKGRALKAVIPGGSSTPVLVPQPCEALASEGAPEEEWPLETSVDLDFDSVARAGSMFGSAGMMVLDENTCMVRTLAILGNFYAHESCGQCTPCREGTGWVSKMLWRIENGEAADSDLATVRSASSSMLGTTICPLAEAFAMPVRSYLAKFEDEFEQHIERRGCWFPAFELAPHGESRWEDTP